MPGPGAPNGTARAALESLAKATERAARRLIDLAHIEQSGAADGDSPFWDGTKWSPRSTTGNLVPLGSSGWKYLPTTLADASTAYAATAYDDSAWATGTAAFGNGAGEHSVNTAFALNTRIWLRRTIPAGSSFAIYGLVDNTADIYWNGTKIATATGADIAGAAAFGPITVPASVITSGPQVLAVMAADDAATPAGDISLIDVSVSTGAPAPARVTISATHPASTVLPLSYPEGVSFDFADAGASAWPGYGFLTTMRVGTDVTQIFYNVLSTQNQRRYASASGGGNVWSAWTSF